MQYKLYPASLYYNPFCCNLPVPSCHSCYSISPYKSPSVSDTLTYSIGTSRREWVMPWQRWSVFWHSFQEMSLLWERKHKTNAHGWKTTQRFIIPSAHGKFKHRLRPSYQTILLLGVISFKLTSDISRSVITASFHFLTHVQCQKDENVKCTHFVRIIWIIEVNYYPLHM